MAGRKALTQKLEDNFMDLVYEKNPDLPWKKKKTGVVVMDMEHKGFFPAIAQKFFGKPRVSHVSLDRYGSVFWEAVDGERTVHEVILFMQEAFPEDKDDMLKRVVTFFRTLEVNRLVRKKNGKKTG